MSAPVLSFVACAGWSRCLLAPQVGLVIATTFWAGNFVIGRALRGEIEPLALNFWRWTIAAIVLAPFAWSAFRVQWPVLRSHWKYVTVLGITGFAVPHTCSYAALQTTSPVNALLLLNLMPVYVAVVAWRVFAQPMQRVQWIGILVALLGAASILVRWDWDAVVNLHFNRGDLWMLPAVACAGTHTLLLKKTPPGVTQGPLLFSSVVAAVLLMVPVVAWTGVGRLAAVADVWQGTLYVGTCASAAAFFLWNRGVVFVGPQRAAPFMYMMPVYASLLSAVFLNESVQRYQVAGGAIVVAGLYLARKTRERVPWS
ncbi:MAG: DMT family transporter [Ramlibacter sp.]